MGNSIHAHAKLDTPPVSYGRHHPIGHQRQMTHLPHRIDTMDQVRTEKFTSRITAVFTTFNSGHVIGRALRALPEGMRVIVVDNASIDETANEARQAHQSLELVQLPKNGGFGRGCNVGLRMVETEYAVVINPDLFVGEHCLSTCLAAADAHPEVALIGSRQNKNLGSGTKITDIEYCDQISGAFMFMRMSSFQEIGLFDENIFMYFEDNDICIRTRLAGYKIAHSSLSEVTHIGAGSTQQFYDSVYEKSRIWGCSCAYFSEKYKNLPEGKAASRKIKQYYIRYYRNLLFNRAKARRYAERIRGWKEYLEKGPLSIFENEFTK